jgi:hypothetical protein
MRFGFQQISLVGQRPLMFRMIGVGARRYVLGMLIRSYNDACHTEVNPRMWIEMEMLTKV